MNIKLATLCYIRRNGKTLMLHRVKKHNDMHQGKWNGLGGKLEPGESPEECAIREVYEEAGLYITKPTMKGMLTFPGFTKNEDWYVFVFLVREFTGTLITSNEGILQWIDNNELLDLNLWEGDKVFLPWLDRSGFFSGKFNYKDGQLIDFEAAFYD